MTNARLWPIGSTALLLFALLASSCRAPAPVLTPAEPEPPPLAPAEPGPISTEVRALLDRAAMQTREQLLTTPPGNNALETLDQALAREPNHPDVVEAVFRGRERIVESYLELTDRALQRGDLVATERYLALATQVDAEHFGLPPMRERLRLARGQRDRRVALDAAELTSRAEGLRERLQAIGAEVKQAGAQVLIQARSDEDGRWLYEQLNAAPGGRLRAELRLGAPGLEIRSGPAVSP